MKEVSPNKETVLLLNKADLLTTEQRQTWGKYFVESDMKALFFSATLEEYDENKVDEIGFGSCQILSPDEILNVMQAMSPNETFTVGFTGTLCSRNFQNVKLRSTIQEFLCHSIMREIHFGKI